MLSMRFEVDYFNNSSHGVYDRWLHDFNTCIAEQPTPRVVPHCQNPAPFYSKFAR